MRTSCIMTQMTISRNIAPPEREASNVGTLKAMVKKLRVRQSLNRDNLLQFAR